MLPQPVWCGLARQQVCDNGCKLRYVDQNAVRCGSPNWRKYPRTFRRRGLSADGPSEGQRWPMILYTRPDIGLTRTFPRHSSIKQLPLPTSEPSEGTHCTTHSKQPRRRRVGDSACLLPHASPLHSSDAGRCVNSVFGEFLSSPWPPASSARRMTSKWAYRARKGSHDAMS